MKKILLVTIQDFNNLGNRLQNYAMQTILETLDFEVDNLSVERMPYLERKYFINFILKKILILLGVSKYKPELAFVKRRYECTRFTQTWIHNYIYCDREELNTRSWNKYDYAITGSDQVWHNWKLIDDELSYYYLDFIEPSKRIAYAPSFGFIEFPVQDIEVHRRGLANMSALSCREQEGCELVYKLIGKEACKVLDPTLLLKKEDWLKLEKKPKFHISKKYIVQFILGEISSDYQEEVQKIADLNHLSILNINNRMDPRRYSISPEEFIWLIHHAEIVCTDSFHAVVFSIIFEKGLRVFQRISTQCGDMFGRIYDLMKPLGLIDNIYGKGNNISTILTANSKDYMKQERKKSLVYLNNNLKKI